MLIRISGYSMKGKVDDGDHLILRRLLDPNSIIYGDIYVVVTRVNKQVTCKFLTEHQEDPTKVWLTPYNIEQFSPQAIEKEDILELYPVVGKLTQLST